MLFTSYRWRNETPESLRDKWVEDGSRQSGFGKTIQDGAEGGSQPWSWLNPSLSPKMPPKTTLIIVIAHFLHPAGGTDLRNR